MASKDSSDDFFSSFDGGAPNQSFPRRRPPPPPPARPLSKPQASLPAVPSADSSYYAGKDPSAISTGSSVLKQTPAAAGSSASGYYRTSQSGFNTSAHTSASPSYYGTPAANTASTSSAASQSQQQHAPSWNYGGTTSQQLSQPQQPNVINPYVLSQPKQAPNSSGLESAMDGGTTKSATIASSYQPTYSSTGFIPGSTDHTASQFSGTMDSKAQPTTFVPQHAAQTSQKPPSSMGARPYDPNEFAHEPPLLEELGINIEHIVAKTRAVVLPFQRFGGNMDATVIQDADLAGPIALALLLGGELLLSAKIHFGYIYGFGLFGCLAMTLVLNLMSPHDAISVWTVTSILGYSLLPVNLLAVLKIFLINLGRLETLGRLLGVLTVMWCTVSSTRLMEQGCNMRDQRYLIAYPICLLYSAFVLITIF